ALDPLFAIHFDEVASDLGVLVLIVDEWTTLADRCEANAGLVLALALKTRGHRAPASAIHGDVAGRHATRAHVLVVPAVRWRVDAVRTPLDHDHLIRVAVLPRVDAERVGPKVNVPFALEPDEQGALSVVVSLVVAPNGPLGDMARGKATGHPIACELAPGDLLLHVLDRLVEHVGDEVRVPDAQVVAALGHAVLGALEVVLTGVVDTGEVVVAREHELEGAGCARGLRLAVNGPPGEHAVHDFGRRRHAEVEHRLPAEVVHAVVGVLRRREEASLAPLEGALGTV